MVTQTSLGGTGGFAVLSVLVILCGMVFAFGAAGLVVAEDDDDDEADEVVAGSPDIEAYVADNVLIPGEATELGVELNNVGELEEGGPAAQEAEVQTAESTVLSADSGDAPLSVRTAEQPIGQLPPGTGGPFGIEVIVDEDAQPGTYEVDLVLSYEHVAEIRTEEGEDVVGDDGVVERDRRMVTETVPLEIEIDERARFEVVSTEGDLQAGEPGDVSVTLRNVGDEVARNATVGVDSPDAELSFPAASATDSFAGDWEPGEERTFDFGASVADDAEARNYTLEASVTFDDRFGLAQVVDGLSAGVGTDAEQSFGVEIDESTLQVGADGIVRGSLENQGPRTADDVSVLVDTDVGVTDIELRDSERRLGSLDPGEAADFELRLGVGEALAAGPRTLNVRAAYRTTDGDRRESGLLDARVAVDSAQSFAIENVTSELEAGTDGTVEADLVNEGPKPVDDVVVAIQSDNPNLDPREFERAVGTLEPGDTARVSFTVGVRSDATAGDRTLSTLVTYRSGADADRGQADDRTTETDVDFVVGVADEQEPFEVEAVDATAPVGGDAVYRVEVTNLRDEPLRDIEAKFFTNDPIDSDDDEAFIPELEPGESTVIEFTASVAGDARNKTYATSVDFRYDDADGDSQLTDTYRLPIEVTDDTGGVPFGLAIGSSLALVSALGVALFRREELRSLLGR